MSTTKKKAQVWIYRKKTEGDLSLADYDVLLLLLKPERGSYWQPVTGKVDPGEAFADAAAREAKEETGLKFETAPYPLNFAFQYQKPNGEKFEEEVFALCANSLGTDGVQLDPHEHVNFKWIQADRVLQELAPMKHPSNEEGLRRLLDLLQSVAK